MDLDRMQKRVLGLMRLHNQLLEHHSREQKCKRKTVVATTFKFTQHDQVLNLATAANGPADGFACKNVVGNCGCSHAEPLCLIRTAKLFPKYDNVSRRKSLMVSTYSPCSACAGLIINSGLIDGYVYVHLTEHDTTGRDLLQGKMPVVSLKDVDQFLVHLMQPTIVSGERMNVLRDIERNFNAIFAR